MSGVHFAVETDERACYLRDLGSRNGTLLNGQPVKQHTLLRQGDEIRAGDTVFRVEVEGGAPPAKEISAVGASADGGTPPTAAAAPRVTVRRGNVVYHLEACDSGLTLCRGEVAQIRPADLANLLAQKVPFYLIADLKKIGLTPPADHAAYDWLFDWFPPETALLVSPLLLSQNQYPDWPTVVEKGWGNDSVVGVFTQLSRPRLLEHLRLCLRAKPKREELSGGMIGFCWPSVMSMLLAHGMPNWIQQLLSGIEAVLVELPDLPETWQVYGFSRIAEQLDQLGFIRQGLPETMAGSKE
jgi:hypothetical protein